jgi:hypothetical protein
MPRLELSAMVEALAAPHTSTAAMADAGSSAPTIVGLYGTTVMTSVELAAVSAHRTPFCRALSFEVQAGDPSVAKARSTLAAVHPATRSTTAAITRRPKKGGIGREGRPRSDGKTQLLGLL